MGWLIVLLLTACTPVTASPSQQIVITTQTPAPAVFVQATLMPRSIDAATRPAYITMTPNPILLESTMIVHSSVEIIGMSVEGRALTAYRFGTGSRALVLVGGIHGGYEMNTITLMIELSAYFDAHPDAIPTGAALVIIPAANPDGMARGQNAAGRFNSNGVDLNRNWSCEWSPDAVWRSQPVSPGAAPLSEAETQAIAAYLLRIRPAAALFFHSAANGVFAGNCNGDQGSAALAQVIGVAANYPYQSEFTAYPVTGTAPAWADGQGIPAADVELTNQQDTEFERNLRGVIAVLEWISTS